jgi:radical SAM family uncharacterized protein
MEEMMQQKKVPLLSLESCRPLREFDIIGFSLDYELTYTNMLNMLDLAGVPVLAVERDGSHPLVIAGGTCALNPEPMSDFIDLFVIGDGEDAVLELLDGYRAWFGGGKRGGRRQLLLRLAAIPGVYVPSLYDVEYEADGRLKSLKPHAAEASPVIRRRLVNGLPPPVTSPVVPFIEVTHDRAAVEIQRGCSCGCRFCQAGMIYRPVRERSHGEVLKAVDELISSCGYDEVSLVSLNTSDYAGIDRLVREIARKHPQLAVSLPSLRLDESAIRLLDSLPSRSKTGLTFAPEAGSTRLQRVINKQINEEDVLEAAATAFERGWTGLKLYFMVGLPTETLEDVADIVRLVERVRSAARKGGKGMPQLRISVSTFVPKAHTPFQWLAQADEEDLGTKHEVLQQGLSRKGIRLSWSNPATSLLEAVMSRGDRRLGRAIYSAWRLGCRFDAWTERFRYESWRQAFKETGIEPAFYAHRERSLDELLPWAHIDAGVTGEFLKREYRRALEESTTPDCRYDSCSACGLHSLHPACRQKLGTVKES